MSIYSGFATRSMETAYNRGVCHLLQLCQAHLLALLKGEPIDVPYLSQTFTKIFRNLKKLEQHKHLQPKYTLYCTELADNFGSMDKPLSHANSSFSSINGSELDLQILNEAMAYDSSSIHRYTPAPRLSRPDYLIPEPRDQSRRRYSKDISRKQTYSSRYSGSPPPYEHLIGGSRGKLVLQRPRRMKAIKPDNIAELYQERALSKLHQEIRSFM
ncbi:unnamed protein product [Blepharisma stoltei]|uniref:Uncharacterized protein n=1 Tax=Blepharisma stoltei TaxID=1481888 RepID=A0AAU9K0W6_9CILI|nr:unnamed protein product [Blepharisma stoltei]